MQNKSVLNSTA